MQKVTPITRVMYCVYAGGLFNFGSVMFWATAKVVFLPNNGLVRALFASLTSVCFLAIGREYVKYIDSLVPDNDLTVVQ
jgi:hypothetical protein